VESNGHVAHLVPGFRRGTEDTGAPSGKDGDAQWKRWGWPVEKMGMASGKDGDGQWKRWGWPVEKMGMASGKDGDVQWKRWGWPVEKMGMASGKDGDGQWKRWGWPVEKMGMASGRCPRISPANRTLSCGSCTLAYVVHVLLNAFVCTTGRKNHGEVSRGSCANAVRAG
jgi:hypothetical protein